MKNVYYCPNCNHKLEEMSGCGSVSYFCNECKILISRQKILTEKQMVEKVVKKVVSNLNN